MEAKTTMEKNETIKHLLILCFMFLLSCMCVSLAVYGCMDLINKSLLVAFVWTFLMLGCGGLMSFTGFSYLLNLAVYAVKHDDKIFNEVKDG